jgi:hypothetical protein
LVGGVKHVFFSTTEMGGLSQVTFADFAGVKTTNQ